MSSCGKNCSCGSDCKCGSGCGCSMYPDIENTTTATLITGVAPSAKMYTEGFESSFGVEGGNGCTCGDNCKCNPCTC